MVANPPAPVPKEDTIVHVGTYTDPSILAHDPKGEQSRAGIHSFKLNAATGELESIGVVTVGPNPAFLLQHPTKPIIWASTEQIAENGEVLTLKMEAGGKLSQVSSFSAGGKSTCYLTLMPDQEHLVAVNYWDAKLAVMPLDADGGVAGEAMQVTMQAGAEYCEEKNPSMEEHWAYRQRWPHTHCCVTEPYTNGHHFVTDLGTDSLCVFGFDAAKGGLEQVGRVHLRKQHGPRHIVFHPTLRVAFIVNELVSSVSVFEIGDLSKFTVSAEGGGVVEESSEEDGAVVKDVQLISTLPEGVQNSGTWHPGGVWKADSHCSEIRCSRDGKFLYVGNRGHDSIAVFAIDQVDGSLTRTACNPSGGEYPRNFNFSACGTFMVVGNQRSNNLSVFDIHPTEGTLKKRSEVHVPAPNFVFTSSSDAAGIV